MNIHQVTTSRSCDAGTETAVKTTFSKKTSDSFQKGGVKKKIVALFWSISDCVYVAMQKAEQMRPVPMQVVMSFGTKVFQLAGTIMIKSVITYHQVGL